MAAMGITGRICRLALRRSLTESRLCRYAVVTGARHFSRSLRPTTTTTQADVPSQCHKSIVLSKGAFMLFASLQKEYINVLETNMENVVLSEFIIGSYM